MKIILLSNPVISILELSITLISYTYVFEISKKLLIIINTNFYGEFSVSKLAIMVLTKVVRRIH